MRWEARILRGRLRPPGRRSVRRRAGTAGDGLFDAASLPPVLVAALGRCQERVVAAGFLSAVLRLLLLCRGALLGGRGRVCGGRLLLLLLLLALAISFAEGFAVLDERVPLRSAGVQLRCERILPFAGRAASVMCQLSTARA